MDEGVGEGDDGEHLEEEDAEVDHVVGVEFCVAAGVEEDVAEGERGWIEGVPVAVDDAGPLVGAHEVADVHVGYGVAVDLVGVVEGVTEGGDGGEEAVERPEPAQPMGEAGGLWRGCCCHIGGVPPLCLCLYIIADAMRRIVHRCSQLVSNAMTESISWATYRMFAVPKRGRKSDMLKRVTEAWTTMLLLALSVFNAWAQSEEVRTPATGVIMRIDPLKNPLKVGDNMSIRVKITNNTNDFLILHFVPDLSTLIIGIHDVEGKVPKETDEGCRRHRSKMCATERQNGGSGSSRTAYVLPGKEAEINADVSLEYLVNYPNTFTVDVVEYDFVAVAAPRGTDIFSLENYPHRQLGVLRSNSINIQVVP